MGEANVTILAFNRGRVSPKALARIDVARMAFSADVQTNLPPRVLGSMSLRPGWQYLLNTYSDAVAKYLPFIFSTTDIALVEITAGGIRFIVGDAVVTRPSVSTSIANGTFNTTLTSWVDNDEAGAASAWLAGGYMELVGTLYNAAIRRQQVTVAGGDQGVAHGVTFTIARGPVSIKIGSTTGGDEYIAETELGTGTYSFVFTPTGDFHIELAGRAQAKSLVDAVAVDGTGDFVLPSPWGVDDLDNLRFDQSADVLFIACDGYQTRRIDRYNSASTAWAVSLYEPADGPFRGINISTITLTPSALTGDITLTASRSFFASTHVGALFKLTSIGQQVTLAITAADQFTNDIRVIGVGASRKFTIVITGTFVGTVTLQRSIDETGAWADVSTWTAPVSTSLTDGLDNQIIYYRIGIKTGNYTSGTATATLTYASGGVTGVARVTAYTGSTAVSAAVLTPFGGTDATRDWHEGAWSTARGFPSAVAFYEGRLWWAGKGSFFGSISDAFSNFDDDYEGDAGPINRSIAAGPVDVINWLLPLQRLIAGTAGAEISVRSNSLDEPLTPSNFNLKDASTQGSAQVPAVKVDSGGVFLQRGGTRVFELAYNINKNDYAPTDLTDIVPEIGEPSIIAMAVQRQPDTRVHCVRSDGTVGMLVREPDNEVLAWIDIETDGTVLDVVILPGTVEDRVYYEVERVINSSTVRFLEKWALESECVGGTLNKQADSFVTFTNGSPSATVTGLTHLIGESVVVWADGLCLKDAAGAIATFTVNGSGEITLTNEGVAYLATTGIAGLTYMGRFQSTKLAYASQMGTALCQRKRMSHMGMVMANIHAQGVKYGPSFTVMDDLPLIDNEGAEIDTDEVYASYDKDMFEWPGGWGPDERMCLEMNAPRPATVMGVVIGIEEHDKS